MPGDPTHDELGEPTLKVVGFQVWVHGRERPLSADDDEDNWLRVTAHCGSSGASVWASGSILEAQDIVRLRHGCERLERGSVAVAELVSAEPNLNVSIRPTDSLGHFEMRVEITPALGQQEHVFIFELDQSYLPEIVRQCRAFEAAYPVRGVASRTGV